LHKGGPLRLELLRDSCIAPTAFHTFPFLFSRSSLLLSLCSRTRFLQQQRETDCDQHTNEHRLKRSLEMRQLQLRRTTGNLLQLPAKHRTQQRTESEVHKIDDTGSGASKLRRVHFFNDGVRQHCSARSDSGNEAKHIRREDAGWSKEYPGDAIEKN